MTKLGTTNTKNTKKRTTERDWQRVFLDALVDTSNISASARKAKVSTTHVYRTRREDEGFAEAWDEALYEGYIALEMDLLGRLRAGELAPLPSSKRRTRKFENAVALRLIAAHREAANRHRANKANVSAKDVRASIERKVEAMRKQISDERSERSADE